MSESGTSPSRHAADSPAGESTRRSFTKNTAWVFVSIIIYSGSQWLLLVLLGRLGSPELLGNYSLGVAIATPVFTLLGQHIRPAYIADVEGRWTFPVYFGLSIVATALALFVVFLLGLWSAAVGALGLVVVAGGVRAAEAVSDTIYAVEHRRQQLRSVSLSRIAKGVLSVGIFPAALWLTDSATTAISLVLIAWFIVFVGYDMKLAARHVSVVPSFVKRELGSLARRLWPIGAAAGLLALASQLPIYTLDHLQGPRAVGYFTAVFSVLYFGRPITQSLATVSSPRLARLFPVDRRRFLRLLAVTTSVCVGAQVLVFVAALVAGRQFLLLAYGPAFENLENQLTAISGVGVILALGTVLSQALTAIGRYAEQFRIHLAMAVIAAVACWTLVSEYGIIGAIAALGVASTARAALILWVLFREVRSADRQALSSTPE